MGQLDDYSLLESASDVGHLVSPLALRKALKESRNEPFRIRPHQKLISDAVVDAFTGRGPRFVAVSVMQQMGKSEITSLATPEYVLELHSLGVLPGGLCGLVSYEDSLAMSWSTKIRRDIESNPDFFNTKLRKDSRAASSWESEQGGGLIAVGTSGSIQGRAITFLGIDDPTKSMDLAMSPNHQDKLWDLWCSVLVGRLQPWSVVLVTMARMAPDDFVGRLKSLDYEGDPEDWKFISIPYLSKGKEDPLERPEGEPLRRPQTDQTLEEALQESESIQKTTSPYIFQCMWQQDPRDPEGTIFPESKWRIWGGESITGREDERTELPTDFDQVLFSLDSAFKDLKTSDWVVCLLVGRIEMDYYLIDLIRGRWSFTETCKRLSNFTTTMRLRYPKATTVVVEDKANGPAIIDALRSRVGGLVEFNPSDYGSKLARAWAVQPYVLGGNVYVPAESERPWVRGFKAELANFRGTGNEVDDQCDSFTQSLLYSQKFQYAPSSWESGEDIDLTNLHATDVR